MIDILHPVHGRHAEVLTEAALQFLADLHRRFEPRRQALLGARIDRQALYDTDAGLDFRRDTAAIRAGDWTIAPIPVDLLDRRVEITGPTDRKMIINALNSGARVFMADFEDAHAPVWGQSLDGQVNLMDRWRGALDFEDRATGRIYLLRSRPAVLMVRPRGWHLLEAGLRIDGAPIAGALFDFGLYLHHNAKHLLAAGTGPYFYLPKLESMEEAALWDDVFRFAQEALGLPAGTIKATVLIETLPAAFEMDEILYALRDHVVGLNCGRWDYMFSFIKKLQTDPMSVLPDRGRVVMGEAFLEAYSKLLIRTCHRRGAFAMGGMAAQIPNRKDPAANAEALARVTADKQREVSWGHDGTWVAHPDLVPTALAVFDQAMAQSNQLDRPLDETEITREDLLRVHEAPRTEAGLRGNIRVGVQYIEAWLRGKGAVPLYNLMEDAATAEISRAQVWQWLRHRVTLEDGQIVDPALFDRLMVEEVRRVRVEIGERAYTSGRFFEAEHIFRDLVETPVFEEFLTLRAYDALSRATA